MENTMTDINAYHLNANPSLYEVQKTNAFKFIVTGLDNLVSVTTGEVIPDAADTLKWSVTGIDTPSITQSPLEVRRGNTVMKSAGTPVFTNGRLALNDFVGAGTYDVLLAWQNLSFNFKTRRVGLMSEYKKDAYLIEYTTDFAKVVRVWHLFGCWVTSLSKTGFNNAANADNVGIDCSIEFDYAMPESPDSVE